MFDWDDIISKPASWLENGGSDSEIVMSSRVRVARNLADHRFTHNCDNAELSEILDIVRSAASGTEAFSNSLYAPMGEISSLDRQFLAERHLASRDFLFNSVSRGIVFNESETLSLMINEEDHLRIQGLAGGFDLESAWRFSVDLGDALSPRLEFAFSDRLGYLTACPTNLGTGMRVSVLIHLPGLVHSKEINKLLDSLRKLNHSIRGLYGEGSEVMGNFFQLSNSATLGTSEDVILASLKEMVGKVISFEQRAREMLFRKARRLLEDKVWRAYGLLQFARSINTKEALSLISAVRLGVGMGIISDVSISSLNRLLVYTQPAHLQKFSGATMDARERDAARAEFIRDTLSNPTDNSD